MMLSEHERQRDGATKSFFLLIKDVLIAKATFTRHSGCWIRVQAFVARVSRKRILCNLTIKINELSRCRSVAFSYKSWLLCI